MDTQEEDFKAKGDKRMHYVMLRFPNFRDKAVTLSYDDGIAADKKLVAIMQKYGVKGTFNLNSGRLSTSPSDTSHLTREEVVKHILSTGNEVAVHGVRHLSLAEVDSAMATDDIITDRKNLEEITGAPVRGMAYANGSFNDNVVRMLELCGIVYARTTRSTENFDIPDDWLRLAPTCHHDNPRLMELVQSFLEKPQSQYLWGRRPRLFYLWGHSYEFDKNGNWNVIEEFCKVIGNRDDVWYATNMEIYAYVQAYNRLQYTADGTKVYNPSVIDIYLEYFGKQIVVPAGQTVCMQRGE